MPNDKQKRKVAFTLDDTEGEYLDRLQGKTLNLPAETEIRSSNWQDTFRNYFSPVLRGTVTGIGEAAGATVAGPAGFAGGGILADQLFQLGQRLSPRTLGAAPSSPFESAKQSGEWVAGDVLFTRGIPALKGAIKNKILNLFSPNPNIPIREAIENAPRDLPLTTAQTTQNRFARGIEDLVTKEKNIEPLIAKQQTVLRREGEKLLQGITGEKVPGSTSTQQLARLNQQLTSTRYEAAHTERKRLYDSAKKEISKVKRNAFIVEEQPDEIVKDPNDPFKFIKVKKPPKLITTEIEGPVYPTRSGDFSKNIIGQIDEYLENPANRQFETPESIANLKNLRAKLNTFISGEMVDEQIKPVMSYDTAQEDVQTLSRLLKQTSPNIQTRLNASIRSVRDLLSSDIRTSSAAWDKPAAEALTRAQDYHKRMFVKVYGSDLAKKLANTGKFTNDPNINQEELFKLGLKDATTASQIVHATGSRTPLATEYVKEFWESLVDENKLIGGTGGVKFLEDSKEVARKFLTADQRAALQNFARLAQASTYTRGNVGKVALGIRLTGATFGVAGGILTGINTGSISQGATTGALILATVPYAESKISRMMLNPANARLAAKLTKLAPDTPEAISIQKKLFKTALRGVRFHLQQVTGESLGYFEPREDGKLHPVRE